MMTPPPPQNLLSPCPAQPGSHRGARVPRHSGVPTVQYPAGFGERLDPAQRWEMLNPGSALGRVWVLRPALPAASVSRLIKQIKASPAQ